MPQDATKLLTASSLNNKLGRLARSVRGRRRRVGHHAYGQRAVRRRRPVSACTRQEAQKPSSLGVPSRRRDPLRHNAGTGSRTRKGSSLLQIRCPTVSSDKRHASSTTKGHSDTRGQGSQVGGMTPGGADALRPQASAKKCSEHARCTSKYCPPPAVSSNEYMQALRCCRWCQCHAPWMYGGAATGPAAHQQCW